MSGRCWRCGKDRRSRRDHGCYDEREGLLGLTEGDVRAFDLGKVHSVGVSGVSTDEERACCII